MAVQRTKRAVDEWETAVRTKSYDINEVLRDATKPLSEAEINAEIERRGLSPRGSIKRHLDRLEGKYEDGRRHKPYIRRVPHDEQLAWGCTEGRTIRWIAIEKTPLNCLPAIANKDKFDSLQAIAGRERAADISEILAENGLNQTTRLALVNARMGHGKFRESVLRIWSRQCAVTSSKTLAAIRSSHIKPWRESTNVERLDPHNGLPLIATLDALFDRGLISFDHKGRMIVASQLNAKERRILGLRNLSLRRRPSQQMAEFFVHHRKAHGFED